MIAWSETDYQAYLARQGAPLPEALTEGRFLAKILGVAQRQGWLSYHTHNSRRSAPGFPDLVLCRPGELLCIEVKTAQGKLTLPQQTWLQMLERVGTPVEVAVWRPGEWPAILTRLTRPLG